MRTQQQKLDYNKKYYQEHREYFSLKTKKYHDAHRKELLQKKRAFYAKNIEKLRKASMERARLPHVQKAKREYDKTYFVERRKTDIQFRLGSILRVRLGNLFRKGVRPGSPVRDLGCSLAELKLHLEKQFTVGMTWENQGLNGWHIDHRIPLSIFDLTDRDQFLRACHYTNLQPMWAIENIKKGNKMPV